MSKSLYATRTFKDEGTGKRFAAGDQIKDVSDGALANYEAAGLAVAKADAPELKAKTA